MSRGVTSSALAEKGASCTLQMTRDSRSSALRRTGAAILALSSSKHMTGSPRRARCSCEGYSLSPGPSMAKAMRSSAVFSSSSLLCSSQQIIAVPSAKYQEEMEW